MHAQPHIFKSQTSESKAADVNEIKQELRENVADLADDLRKRSLEAADTVSDRARTYFHGAGYWMKNNYGKTIAIVGAVAVVSFASYYLISRRSSKASTDRF